MRRVFPVGGVDDLAKKIGISVSGNRKVQPISAALVNGGEGVEFYLPDIVRGDTLAISIEEGAVKDKRDNLNEPAALAELSVVDTTPPRLLESQDNVYEITSYTLRFDETITVKADTAARIKVDGQAAASAVLGADGQSLQLELAAVPVVGSSVVFAIEAGAVADSSGNDNEARTLSAKTVLNDPTPPALLADQDEIYEDSQNYLIRYDEHVVAVGDAAALASGITLTIDGTVTALSAVSIDNVNRGILLSMPSLSVGQTVDIAIAAAAVRDGVGNSNEAASFQKTVLAEIIPPTAAENQDTLTDADSSFTIRLSEAVSPAADLAQNIVIWYDNQDHAVSSAALTAGKDGIFVEFSSLPAETSVKFIVEAGTLKDKRDNLNLEFSLPSILVQDVTPPRLLEKQDQFSYVIAFSEDLFLVDGIAMDDFKQAISFRRTLSSGAPESFNGFEDGLTITGSNIIMGRAGGELYLQWIQGGGILYLRFPGGMLRDQAGNVIQEDFDIPPYFNGSYNSLKPIGSLYGGGELRELDPFVEWRIKENDNTGLIRLAASEYELVQNISISIDGGEPFHPIYATADGFLKIYLPPVFEGQSVEITLNQGQVAPTNRAYSLLLDPLEKSNEEITKSYQVKGHDSRQVRTLAGFYLGDSSVGTDFGQEVEGKLFDSTHAPAGFYFDHQFGSIAAFNFPMDLDIDGDGNIYVADMSNHRIRKIDTHGAVTTTHGPSYGSSTQPGNGYLDGAASSALFYAPSDLAISGDGNIYVVGYFNGKIRKLSRSEVSTVSIKPNITFSGHTTYMKYTALTEDSQGNLLLGSYDQSDHSYLLSMDKDGNIIIDNRSIDFISDMEMVNGTIYATNFSAKTLVEITEANGALSEKVLATLPYSVTALAAADDGSTFYVAENVDTEKYRISRVFIDPVNGSVSTTVVLERFETTGTQLTLDQTMAIYKQGKYFMEDYHYFPVETYNVPLQGCYGLALDDQGHLIVSDSFSSLILKVFNPDQ